MVSSMLGYTPRDIPTYVLASEDMYMHMQTPRSTRSGYLSPGIKPAQASSHLWFAYAEPETIPWMSIPQSRSAIQSTITGHGRTISQWVPKFFTFYVSLYLSGVGHVSEVTNDISEAR
jgi:hypothetical protein